MTQLNIPFQFQQILNGKNFSCMTIQRIYRVGNKVESCIRIRITYHMSDVQIPSKLQSFKNSNNLCISIIRIGETAAKTLTQEPFPFPRIPPIPALLESTRKLPSTLSTTQSKEEGWHTTCRTTKFSAIPTGKRVSNKSNERTILIQHQSNKRLFWN